MELFKTLIHGKILDTCPICLENIREKHTHTLRCKHQLHKTCYRNLIDNNIHRCPSCRADFSHHISKACQYCHKSIVIDESDCGILKSGDCEGCYFHYNCFKGASHAYCLDCLHPINPENVSALSYLYFQNGFEEWVGPLKKCLHEDCFQIGSPKRYGYCSHHHENQTLNKSIAKTLEYMVRFTNIRDEEERYKIYYKVLSYIDEKYQYTPYEEIVLNKSNIQREISTIH